MSLKKRMFRSNMMILFSALVSLMLIILLVLVLFEDSFERQFHSIGRAVLENRDVEEALVRHWSGLFSTILLCLLLIGAGAIAFLLLLSSFFTRKMNRIVMEPVEKLVKGAERIRAGELDREIEYSGEAEFEHVCSIFNSMQRTILEDQRQRERTERARIDMVTGISHDLRTPLTSIQGYIKGVLDGVADTEEKREAYLRTAYESTEEMDLLLRKLFDFSRMESGQMPFHMVKADLGEFTATYAARKAACLAAPSSARPAVCIRVHRDREVMTEISMDVEQIPRIFDNLLENSVKYAGVDPVCVDISLYETDSSVVLEWKDNGQGVPPEKLPHIFERFYRCDEARAVKGSGVGLYVAGCIMERHGGSVEAENEGGLKVRLSFPKEV